MVGLEGFGAAPRGFGPEGGQRYPVDGGRGEVNLPPKKVINTLTKGRRMFPYLGPLNGVFWVYFEPGWGRAGLIVWMFLGCCRMAQKMVGLFFPPKISKIHQHRSGDHNFGKKTSKKACTSKNTKSATT